ncbi:MAG: hypothetical protein IKV81_06540 [Clostridia bacterium]|nr:hypothetical protein [Clostridia bacterium]
MGLEFPPIYGKSKFYARKKQKAAEKILKYEDKIKEQKEIIIICEKELDKK